MQDTRHTVDTRDSAPVDIENLQCLLELHISSGEEYLPSTVVL